MKSDSCTFISFYRPAAVLRVSGEDALAFLQGQFTQELRFSVGTPCVYGLWLNQKGKVLADSFALRDGPAWWLVSYTSAAASIRERLEAYIIADDVVVEDFTERWSGAVMGGVEATSLLLEKGFKLPAAGEWASVEGGLVFRGRRGGVESWEWLSPSDIGGPEEIAKGGFTQFDATALERLRIQSGVPSVPRDVGPGDLPNEGGLEDVAISYSKGCYLGQEVMARLKSMGQVRRKLLRVQGAGPAPVCPSALYSETKKVGEIRSAVSGEGENTFIGLAMISLLGLDSNPLLSLEMNGPRSVQVLRDLA